MKKLISEIFQAALAFIPLMIILGTSSILLSLWLTLVWVSILLFVFAILMTLRLWFLQDETRQSGWKWKMFRAAAVTFYIGDVLVNQIFGSIMVLKIGAQATYTERLARIKEKDKTWRRDWAFFQCDILSAIQRGKHC